MTDTADGGFGAGDPEPSRGPQEYAWYVTFEVHDEVQRLAYEYQRAMHGIMGVEPVPVSWLRLPVQRVGPVGDFSGVVVDRIAAAARSRLSGSAPARLIFRPPALHRTAVVLRPLPAEALLATRAEIRAAIAAVCGADRVPEQPGSYRPFVEIAGGVLAARAAEVAVRLRGVRPAPAHVTVAQVSLIVGERAAGWSTVATAALGRARGSRGTPAPSRGTPLE